MDEPLKNLLSENVIGVDGNRFLLDQTTLIAAMQRTDRVMMLRILSKIENRPLESLINESGELDKKHLIQIVSDAEKFVM